MEKKDIIFNLVRCPVCFEVIESCNPQKCELQCIASCEQGAIKLKDKAEIDLGECNNCSRCVQICPQNAIDKTKLFFDFETKDLRCPRCNSNYSLNGNIFYFYPKRFDNRQFRQFYETFEGKLDPWQERVARNVKVKNILNILNKNGKIPISLLDIGCSNGWVIDSLRHYFYMEYITGLDISSSVLEQIKGKIPCTFFIAGDCEYLPLARHSYDIALAVDVIEHIYNPVRFLREMSRVSKNLILKIPIENVFENIVWHILEKVKDIIWRGSLDNENFEQHINCFTKKDILKLLKGSGLDLVSSYIPDNPIKREYASFYFASPKRTMPDFRRLPLNKKVYIMVKYYIILFFRRFVFIALRPFYHHLCYSSFYVLCNSKQWSKS